LINKTIGHRYLVREFLGEGAHARVYRATDAFLGGDVALKRFHSGALDVAEAEAARDAQRAEASRHFEVREGPAILPILEVHPEFLEGEVTIMPLMERTLADMRPILASEARHRTRSVLTTLDFCHGRDVIHGDVKPSNVFIDSRGATLLGDFGVRDFLPDGKRGHTLEYAAPELLSGRPRSAASDVWATAVMLYELLTDELPFGSTLDEAEKVIAERISGGAYRPPDDVRPYLPRRVRNFFAACFEVQPEHRQIQSADAMRRELAKLELRAEWVQYKPEGFLTLWKGFEIKGDQRTGIKYSASVRERPGLKCWEAEIKRAHPGGELRRWKGVVPYHGSQKQAVRRMMQWMQNITRTGRP
jgi:serine/threonine protein kinase